jgi:hypothetical protein
MITVSNHQLVVTIDESLGGEIQQIEFEGDPILAFDDWLAPVRASRSRTYGDAKLDWLSEYRGGWQLLIPNTGSGHGPRSNVSMRPRHTFRWRQERGFRSWSGAGCACSTVPRE